ncbi:hypothetical protein [Agromyces bauzanensis]|uniref:ABM domain-containing protein n=1 Tax=Agromyces bauzanensis TaxID=1308924 RepID=A0A917URR2_9MICO|nr:hypothetical protein [Agromyces bauzanensis]GGJ80157.1 hypothetical protein GCM10011372_18200 [Agromyces bauzanensis]
MQIALARFTLKPGVTEEGLLSASDEFEDGLVQHQDGIIRRVLVRDLTGGYADIVFFESSEAMERVIAAEQDDEVCARYMSMIEDGQPDEFEILKTYE